VERVFIISLFPLVEVHEAVEMLQKQIVKMVVACLSVLLSYVGIVFLEMSGVNAPHPSLQEDIANLFNLGWLGRAIFAIATIALPCLWAFFRPQKVTLFDSLVVAMPATIWGLFLFNSGAFTAIIRSTV
jgi:hypothetical protein